MNSYDLKAAVACDLPGVTTEVVQVVDLSALDKTQLNRLVGACKRGYMSVGGYVSELVKMCAKEAGVQPPMQTRYWSWDNGVGIYHKLDTLPDTLVDHWMKVSDVRAAIAFAQAPPHNAWGPKEPSRSRRNMCQTNCLYLAGWDKKSMPEFRKAFSAAVKEACPDYVEGLAKLERFIAAKPRFTYRRLNAGTAS